MNDYNHNIKSFFNTNGSIECLFINVKEITSYKYYSNTSFQFYYDLIKYIFIPTLLITIVALVVLLIINRYGFEKKIAIKNEIVLKTDDFLTELIFSDYTPLTVKSKIKHFMEEVPFTKKWCRDIILNKLITIKQNINGVDSNRILLIYRAFGFHNYSKKLILNRNCRKKLLGIYHYQVLEYKIKTGYIRPYINLKPYMDAFKNKFLNSNALIAVIILSDEKFEILNKYQKKISNADELKILNIIYHKKSSLPSNIKDWLYNKNASIVRLAIKLMVRYREPLKKDQISYLLSTTDEGILKETLLAIRYLYLIEANTILINYYKTETNKRNKISTLKTLGAIGDTETIDFAVSILFNENDLELKFQIVQCINSIDPEFFKNYIIKNIVEKNIINKILLHVNSPYLN